MPTPGIGDPYWFEWYVGLKHVIEMLNPDLGIECVIFQHPSYNTIDDVVVEYKDGTKKICYQVKHEIATSIQHNLTFGKLLEKDKDNPSSKCLLDAIFSGWIKASNTGERAIKPILFTNRNLGTSRAGRTFNDHKYSAYPIDKFLSSLNQSLEGISDYTKLSFADDDLTTQWKEMCNALCVTNAGDIVPFIKELSVQGNQLGLEDMEQSLISALAEAFSCSKGMASELFGKLVFALRLWTTSRRSDERVTIEDIYSTLGTEEDINESQHRLAPPYPFFESRQAFCKELEQQIATTNKKVVFISGDPGSGKTSTISYLQSTTNFFFLRYHTFRPISPEQHFYNVDAGMCSSENLWGTLLIQLRQKLKGKLAQYSVPVNNKLLTVEMMRSHVCRLLGILAENSIVQNKCVYVCIDGIDHAARANSGVSFLTSLPLPSEIPNGVCFVIVGQPSAIYQAQYPIWLSNDDVERVDMPKLCVNDIKQLILSSVPRFETVADGLASFIFQCTEGNNLSTVFAIEEIKEIGSLNDAIAKLSASGITSDVQQYYSHIWNHMKSEILNMGLPAVLPESIVACPILLMNGHVQARILARALPYAVNENDWKLILNKLYPLIVPCGEDGEYSLFHNDFRVFLMGIISGYHERYEEIALALAEDLLRNDEGLLTYVNAIPLLKCANKTNLIPQYFTSSFVINALAEGISKQRLDDFAHLSYKAACSNHDMEGYINTYLAVKSLYQHMRYFEYYGREYTSDDYPEISSIDISEIRVLPITSENLSEYKKVLDLCKKLYVTGSQACLTRAMALYSKWFSSVSPYSFVPVCESSVPEDEDWKLKTDKVGLFLQHWGKTAAELNICLTAIDTPNSKLQRRALIVFGEAYFESSIDRGTIDYAVMATNSGYVPKYCFAEKLEKIFYSGYTNKVEQYLSKISAVPDKPSTNLLAMAMLVTCQHDISFDTTSLEPSKPIQHVYDETSFAIILRAFLHGHRERALDDAVVCGHVSNSYSALDEKEPVLNQISQLSKLACLLGKYYWDSTATASKALVRFTKWFLTTKLWRRHDYSRARKFLLFTLLQSPASEALADEDAFIADLKTHLFEIENIGMYYKTYILDYLQRHNKFYIIKEYILALYGDNCSEISVAENKVEMHNVFRPYGELVEPEMMESFTAQIKWDVVSYMGSKEYAMQGLSECFESISTNDPSLWREAGSRLYRQSKIAEISNNHYAYDIRNSIMKAAVCSGLDDFWELHSWNNEFRINPDLIYHALFEHIQVANCSADLKVIWLLSCGIHSWYTQKERMGAKCIYNACLKKAYEFDTDFRETVLMLTPQWMTIIDHESKEIAYQPKADSYAERKADEIVAIQAEYDSSTIEDLLTHVSSIPVLLHSEERYRIILDRLTNEGQLSVENMKSILESVCTYLDGKEWQYERYDGIIDILLPVLGEGAFWTLTHTIGNHLSDYDYQTSVRNMQLLLKLYYGSNPKQMKMLFEKELATQELWITGNAHIPVDYKFDYPKECFVSPKTLAEMALYILLEQAESQNARKMEAAIFALHILGKHITFIIGIISTEWSRFSEVQKDCLLLIITRWVYDGVDLSKLYDTLAEEYTACNLLSRKYYLHSLLLLMNKRKIDRNSVCCSAESPDCALPISGYSDKSSIYENFLSLTEEHGCSSQIANGIRRYISLFSAKEVYVDDEYIETGDIRIPALNPEVNTVLYTEEKHGRWNGIPLLSKKSRLVPPEDPLILTDMPQIVYDEECFPHASASSYGKRPTQGLNEVQLSKIAHQNLSGGDTLLATYIWYPWGHEDGAVFIKTAKVCSTLNSYRDNRFDWCLGNFGLLAMEGAIDETEDTSIFRGGINLFNRIGGKIRICFGNSQLAPSSAWQKLLRCVPSSASPYVWINENGDEVLRFERIASPTREAMREAYIRQPIIFRWVCHSDWLHRKLKELGWRLWYITGIEEMTR
ncbi:hypothetical protein [Desulfosporosinus sp. SB140]|uniref:hypothetical protein n=1 Tax=Desulfosporosinus paludis TaxID=3115649 RepID=UPI003890B2F0